MKKTSDADVKVNCNEPVLTSDHDTNSELSKIDKSGSYSTESSSPDKGNSFRKYFYGKNKFE
jgi:hypothetical protein